MFTLLQRFLHTQDKTKPHSFFDYENFYFLKKQAQGNIITLRTFGSSMYPTIRSRQKIQVLITNTISKNDVIVFYDKYLRNCITHRVIDISVNKKGKRYICKGDNEEQKDPEYIYTKDILGKVIF